MTFHSAVQFVKDIGLEEISFSIWLSCMITYKKFIFSIRTATDVNLTRALWDTVSTDVSHANFPCCTDCQPPPFTPPNDFPSQMHDNGQWHSNHAWHLCGKHHIKPCEQTTVSPQLSLCQMCMFMASVLSHLYQWGRENRPRKSRNYCRWNSQYHQ